MFAISSRTSATSSSGAPVLHLGSRRQQREARIAGLPARRARTSPSAARRPRRATPRRRSRSARRRPLAHAQPADARERADGQVAREQEPVVGVDVRELEERERREVGRVRPRRRRGSCAPSSNAHQRRFGMPSNVTGAGMPDWVLRRRGHGGATVSGARPGRCRRCTSRGARRAYSGATSSVRHRPRAPRRRTGTRAGPGPRHRRRAAAARGREPGQEAVGRRVEVVVVARAGRRRRRRRGCPARQVLIQRASVEGTLGDRSERWPGAGMRADRGVGLRFGIGHLEPDSAR